MLLSADQFGLIWVKALSKVVKMLGPINTWGSIIVLPVSEGGGGDFGW